MYKALALITMLTLVPLSSFAQTPTTTSRGMWNLSPDSPFWGLQTAIENIQVSLQFNDTKKAQMEVFLAQEKLNQINDMLSKNNTAGAARAQAEHDREVNDVENISSKQNSDNHGQMVKAYVHSLLQDHENKIGSLVSTFAQNNNGTGPIQTFLQHVKATTDNIRAMHGDHDESPPLTNNTNMTNSSNQGYN